MSLSLVAQILYASIAWWFCARSVWRTETFAASSGRNLAGTLRELRAACRDTDIARLPGLLNAEALATLLDADGRRDSAERMVSDASSVSRMAAPPVRVLRSLATMGTMLGLLCAVANLRAGLDASSAGQLGLAASRALDSAVAGFVTALPCWTAAALCGRRARRTEIELELVLLALTATNPDPSARADEASIPGRADPVQQVDAMEPSR